MSKAKEMKTAGWWLDISWRRATKENDGMIGLTEKCRVKMSVHVKTSNSHCQKQLLLVQKADSPPHSHHWYPTSFPGSSALHLACSASLSGPLISELQHLHPQEFRSLWNWSVTEEDRTSWEEPTERKIFKFVTIRAKGKKVGLHPCGCSSFTHSHWLQWGCWLCAPAYWTLTF